MHIAEFTFAIRTHGSERLYRRESLSPGNNIYWGQDSPRRRRIAAHMLASDVPSAS